VPRWSKAQETARLSIEALASSELTLNEISHRTMAALRGAVGWDGYRLFGVDPQTLLINALIAASDNDDWARDEYLSEVYLAADPLNYIELPFLMRAKLPAVAFQDRQDQCWGYSPAILSALDATHHTRQFHEQRSPIGGSPLASFGGDGRWVASLQAYRRDRGSPFRSTDVAFVRAMAKTIGDALVGAITRQQRAARAAGSMDPVTGVLHVRADGTTAYSSGTGKAWIDRLRVAESRPQSLPTACWAAIADLRQRSDGLAGSVAASVSEGTVRVEASAADADGGVELAFIPERASSSRSQLPLEWPLTPRERDVVGCVIDGQRNRTISRTLSIGEHTVEGHLRQIYGKLEVRSRSQLVARWFRECQLSTIQQDAGPSCRQAPCTSAKERTISRSCSIIA
jgi:DNA-binding CsgD family transcriptional regulator